jgi:hypothetical protein
VNSTINNLLVFQLINLSLQYALRPILPFSTLYYPKCFKPLILPRNRFDYEYLRPNFNLETYLLYIMNSINFARWAIPFCLLIAINLKAQQPSLSASIGLSSVRGELTEENLLKDNYGPDVSAGFILPLDNERWAFTSFLTYTGQQEQHDFVNNTKILYKTQPEPVTFQSNTQQLYMGVGLRFYMASSINRYNPYRGQILPYLGLSVGALYSSVILNGEQSVPEQYGLKTSKAFEFATELNGGIGYVINDRITLEIFGALRPGFTDYWDGIKGITETNDWLARAGVGVQYRLR